MTEKWTPRSATAADTQEIARILILTILSDHAPHLPEPPDPMSVSRASDKLSEEWPKMAVVEDDDNVAGLVMVVDNKVEALNVLPRYQGLGAGSALLNWAEHRIARLHSTAEVNTYASNADAIRFYERAGYQVSKRWSSTAFTRLPVDMVTMTKPLS
ncbi:MAG: GNAT family N-acetyltransferase [Armatimonadetes bacterium]|nr:GNAT family N-acetyltransferase [Armatimonadota bacterium]